jgi:hypothetical protein
MANTYDSDLLADRISERTITVLQNKLASLALYANDFGVAPMSPLSTVQVRTATVGGAGQTNPTNFESGDTTFVGNPVTVNHKSKSFHVTSAEINSGHKLEQSLDISLAVFADMIQAVINPLLVSGNFGTAFTGVASTFDGDDAKDIWATIEKSPIKNLILAGAYYAKLMPSTKDNFDPSNRGVFGFDAIAHNSNWANGQANLVGFACNPQAINVASGIPIIGAGAQSLLFDSKEILIPNLGLTVQWNHWGSTTTRADWMSFDVMFGAGVGDTSAGKLMVSA